MPLEIWITLALMPPAYLLGHLLKRRYGPPSFKTQLKLIGIMFAVGLLTLLAVAAFADTRKPPSLASAVRSGAWQYTQKESALPSGPLCAASAMLRGRHVTLKVTGAQMFEATLAVVAPQQKRGNTLSVHVDSEEVAAIHLQHGQAPYPLRIPLPPGAQTLTLTESLGFPKIILCNPTLS
jgi:hypothetical protein